MLTKQRCLRSKSGECGNVLFLILIAVALFAALSYAVTSSSRSGGGSASREKIQMAVNNISNYAVSIKTGIDRLRITNSCTLHELDYSGYFTVAGANFTSGNAGTNSERRANGDCDVFGTASKLVAMKVPKEICAKGRFENGDCFMGFLRGPVKGIGLDTSPNGDEVVLWIRYVDKAVCEEIRKQNGAVIPIIAASTTSFSQATYNWSGGNNPVADHGAPNGCFLYGGDEYNAYFTVALQ